MKMAFFQVCIIKRKTSCVIGATYQSRKWTVPVNGLQLWNVPVPITLLPLLVICKGKGLHIPRLVYGSWRSECEVCTL